MSYPINYPTPQGANVQIFELGGSTSDWVKPQGASFVWFTLIGGGGGGGTKYVDTVIPATRLGGGGASGNVTNFMCPAFLLPDVLQVVVGNGGNGGDFVGEDFVGTNGTAGVETALNYQLKATTGYKLLGASGGGGGTAAPNGVSHGTGGTSAVANVGGPMTAAGFYNATRGQNGADGNVAITTADLIYVMGGSGVDTDATVITGYYGYTATLESGYSQLSPIPLSIPSNSTQAGTKAKPQSYGCGGVGGAGGRGGDGLAIIVTW
jgi:hypothetical protein